MGRIVATVVRRVRDLGLAEELAQEAHLARDMAALQVPNRRKVRQGR